MSEEIENQDRYQLNDIRLLPIGNGSFVAFCPDGGSARILPAPAVEALGSCAELATLTEHAVRLCQSAAGGAALRHPDGQTPPRSLLGRLLGGNAIAAPGAATPSDLRSTLNLLGALAEPGFLISEAELLRLCRDSAGSHPPPPEISSVGIVTRDRPKMLDRCLKPPAAAGWY